MKKRSLLFLPVFFVFLFLAFYLPSFAQVKKNMSVSATVPPKSSDFEFSFASDGQTTAPQNTTLSYTITYGANASAGVSTNTTIIADFSEDRAPGGSHILDYVIGSATAGYGGVQPVVDLTNHTITWNIPALPAGTINQAVTFELSTNENYSVPADPVSFTTKAKFSNQYVTLSDQTTTQTYEFDLSLVTPTPTMTPQPTLTPTPTLVPTGLPGPTATARPLPTAQVTLTPTPTITPAVNRSDVKILEVSFNAISQDAVTIAVTTNRPTKQELHFGTSPSSLKEIVKLSAYDQTSLLDLKNLKPATTYYFQVIVTDENGKTTTSEIFTFTTAKKSEAQSLANNAISVTSGRTLILSDILNSRATTFGLLTTGTDYELAYTFGQTPSVSSVDIVVKGKGGTDRIVHLSPKTPLVYAASLRSGDPASYDLFVRVTDQQGNVTEQQAARLKIIAPLQVYETDTNTPLGDVRIYLWKFNEATQQYESVKTIPNPSATNISGIASFLLPQGRYRVEASTLWHDSRTIDFTLGDNAGEQYPSIYLKSNPLNLISLAGNINNIMMDSFKDVTATANQVAQSIRFFNLIATSAVGSSVLLSAFLFSIRTGIQWKELFPFALFGLYLTFKKHKEAYIYGIVTGHDNKPVSGVRIEFVELKSQTVLTHTITNSSGRFAVKNTFKQEYIKLIASKDGYAEFEQIIETDGQDSVEIHLASHASRPAILPRGFRHVAGELFELAILLSMLFELVFLFSFGVARTLPFFAISVFNLILWIFFQREKKV